MTEITWLKSFKGRMLLVGVPVLVVLAFLLFRGGDTSRLPYTVVQQGTFEVSITETGELRATNSTAITTPPIRTNLQIIYLAPKGEEVQVGDTLVVFDGADLRTKIEEKKAELEIAYANLQKSQASMRSNVAQLEASVKSSKASYRQAELRLQQTQFEAEAVRETHQLELLQAEINLEQAKTRLEQQIKIDSAETRTLELRVEQAKGELESAKRDLQKLTLLAPQPGLVVYKKMWKGGGLSEVKVGDSPWRGLALIELPDLSQMEVITSVNEVDVAKVQVGQKATIVLDAFPDRQFEGKVIEVSNLARTDDESVGEVKVFDVVITITGQDPILKPGMTVSATIYVETIDDAIFIPIDCVFLEAERSVVYRLGDGLRPTAVELGSRNDNYVVVKKGLTANEKISLVNPKRPRDQELTSTSKLEQPEDEKPPPKQGKRKHSKSRRRR